MKCSTDKEFKVFIGDNDVASVPALVPAPVIALEMRKNIVIDVTDR